MKTPIVDFVRGYRESHFLRLHMPGHKGRCLLGAEDIDITEISGADSLYEASGIILESEENASVLFGCNTFYSTEGSSQCVRAMLYLAYQYAKEHNKKAVIAAARNVHKTFLSGIALIGLDVKWIYPEKADTYLSCVLTAEDVESFLSSAEEIPVAIYLTSPDYLGNISDIGAIAKVCSQYGVLLLVDNAHGAYLKFLPESKHPIDLGAHICCDSAHKTLPALTGGAYLHISDDAPKTLVSQARNALSMFGSTSPSYLILQSLDMVNAYISNGYKERLEEISEHIKKTKISLSHAGYTVCGDELLKITLKTKPYGYEGHELADILLEKKIVCEFADPDFLVLMITPETDAEGLTALEEALLSIPKRREVKESCPKLRVCKQVKSIREAMLSPCETVRVEDSVGRILGAPSVGCPPAVPIVVCGEEIDGEALLLFQYYGVGECTVIKY